MLFVFHDGNLNSRINTRFDMYCVIILFVGIFISEVNSQSIEQKIQNYFKSDVNRMLRKQWDNHRKSLENALSLAMRDTIGLGGMNVLIRKKKGKLTSGYFHNDNQVRLLLSNLKLDDLPRCGMPDVQFSLASNLLKVSSILTKMIIYAEYSVVRNKSDIIYDTKDQNPYESSPFLYQQVQDAGKLTMTIEDCQLMGFLMTTLNGDSINLGYPNLNLFNCHYTIEIYMPGEGAPPVIAKYAPDSDNGGLDITHLLVKPIEDELVPKLQAAMFSFVNTSSVFNDDLQDFRNYQSKIFYATSQYLTEVVRNLNRITIEKNKGEIELKDYQIFWDGSTTGNATKGEALMLTDMVVTGLDTLYSAHIGGPYRETSFMIGEEIRFSSLQIRGHILLQSVRKNPIKMDSYGFSAEICDVAYGLQLSVNSEPAQVKRVEVKGFRSTSVTMPSLVFGSGEALIVGYLQAEVPKMLQAHIKANIPEALKPQKKKTSVGTFISEPEKETADSQNEVWSHEFEHKQSDELMRNAVKKAKKRFKSANRPRYRRSADHVVRLK